MKTEEPSHYKLSAEMLYHVIANLYVEEFLEFIDGSPLSEQAFKFYAEKMLPSIQSKLLNPKVFNPQSKIQSIPVSELVRFQPEIEYSFSDKANYSTLAAESYGCRNLAAEDYGSRNLAAEDYGCRTLAAEHYGYRNLVAEDKRCRTLAAENSGSKTLVSKHCLKIIIAVKYFDLRSLAAEFFGCRTFLLYPNTGRKSSDFFKAADCKVQTQLETRILGWNVDILASDCKDQSQLEPASSVGLNPFLALHVYPFPWPAVFRGLYPLSNYIWIDMYKL